MDKKIVLCLLTMAVFVAAVQFAEPASAAYLIDSGSKPVYHPSTKEKTGYWYYKTWNKGYYLHTKISAYFNGGKKFLTLNFYLKKASDHALRITYTDELSGYSPTTNQTVKYPYYKTATHWYWHHPLISNIHIQGAPDTRTNWYTTGAIGLKHVP